MNTGKKSFSLNLNILNEKTHFEKLEENFKVSIFGVLYVLLKNQDFSVWVEVIFVIVQLLQFMAFPFSPMFAKIWKQPSSFTQISSLLQYFQIVSFFQNNQVIYLIAFYLCVFVIILIILNIIYVSVSFSRNKFNLIWPLKLLRSIISILVTVLFLPMLYLLISIFNCSTDSSGVSVNSIVPSIACWSGSYYIHVVVSILLSISFIAICLIVQLTYYETKSSTQNQSAKRSSQSDVFMLMCKLILVFAFVFLSGESAEWILIITLFVLSAFMLLSYHDERPYYNSKIMKVYLVCTGIILWNCTVLLIGKILEETNYDGSIPLFFLGLPIVIGIILTNYEQKLTILLTNINKFHKGETVLKQINYFMELVDKKDHCRNSLILLKGYIYLYEETCSFSECALKKYITSLEQKNESAPFLLQHAETLYQNGISKFPNCTSLRVSYAFFLLERMNKKQQANLELLNTEKYSPKFAEQFIIYRYKKLIEEQSSEISDNEENLDVVSNIAYKNHFTQFKNSVAKVATLYMDFWGLLLNPNQDNNEDLAKLNDYGSKINVLVEEINDHFEKMQKLKHNDQEVIRYYSDFLNDILNDKEKAALFRSRLNEIENSKQNYDDVNLMNVDINSLQASDEYQFVIMSAQQEKFGIVTNVSLGICALFGYSRSELIGKNIEFVMPEIFHKNHRVILQEKINEFKKITMSVQNSVNYKPVFKDVKSYGKNKSRYLVPFNFKVTFIPNNEQNDSVFLAKISQDVYNIGPAHNLQTCHILTNNSFIIQNFTTNAISILGMNSNAINNGNMEITKFIKEFQEEFLKYNIDNEEKSPDQVVSIKRHIISNKFRESSPITWRRVDEVTRTKSARSEERVTDASKLVKDNKFLFNKQKSFLGDKLLLTINPVFLIGKQEGYIFKFDSNLVNKDLDNVSEKSAGGSSNNVNINVNSNINKERRMSQFKFFTPNHNLNVSAEMTKQMTSVSKRGVSFGNFALEDTSMKIDKSFVPQNDWNFQIDPTKSSFLANPKNLNELKETIREEAMKKIKTSNQAEATEGKSESEPESSYNDMSGEQDSANYTYSESSSSEPSNARRIDDYYQVNFQNIKFLVYDLKKESLVEVTDWAKESQVDYKKNEDYKKKDSTDTKKDKDGLTADKETSGDEEVVENGKEGILIKQIEYALNKEETQPTITRMKWLSFFVFLVYVGIAAIFLTFFLNAMSWVTENVAMVYNAYDLIENTIYGSFHVRELVLVNNPNYVNIYQPTSDYIRNNTAIILDLFASSHQLLTSMITTFLTFSEADTVILNTQTIYTTILQDDLTIQKFNLTLSSSFIETNTALYHVAHMAISDIVASDKDVFFFLYNSLNDVVMELFSFGLVYLSELGLNATSFQGMFLYIFIGASAFGVIAYFLVTLSYVQVEKRKESYLEVFFEIGGSVIKNSLEKCENFSKKIQSDSLSDVTSNLDENELQQETNVQTNSSTVKKPTLSKKRKTNNSKEARIIKIKLAFAVMFLSMFFFLVYFMYKGYLDTVQIYANIFENLCLEQTQYLMLFNTLREYFFDYNGSVNQVTVSKLIDQQLNDIYSFKLMRDSAFSKNLPDFPTDYATLYSNVINDNICPYSTDFFTSFLPNVNCTTFLSNSSSYGLNILLTNYVEEMRYLKYNYDLLVANSAKYPDFIYNNTLVGSDVDPTLTSDSYMKNNPVNIFNDATHKNLVILNRFFLRPTFSALKNQLKLSISNSLTMFQTIYLIVFSIFFSALTVLYLFVWRPFENGLNTTIYKTKNMLSIIPKEVLASLSNINKLLDIGQNFSKNKRVVKN